MNFEFFINYFFVNFIFFVVLSCLYLIFFLLIIIIGIGCFFVNLVGVIWILFSNGLINFVCFFRCVVDDDLVLLLFDIIIISCSDLNEGENVGMLVSLVEKLYLFLWMMMIWWFCGVELGRMVL